MCHCGKNVRLYVYNTQRNPNRPFLGCSFYRKKRPCCNYFIWLDEYEKEIGFGNDWVNKVEKKLDTKVAQLDKMVMLLVVCFIVLCITMMSVVGFLYCKMM